jgi:hypothetical protein
MELNGLILLAGNAQFPKGDVVITWPITGFLTTLVLMLVAALCWFIKRECDSLKSADQKNDEKLNNNFTFLIRQTGSIDRRVARIEGHLNLGTLTARSPLSLTAAGLEILKQSGIQEAADINKNKLLEAIKAEKPLTAYDVQEVSRRIFQTFDFGTEITERFKNYCFKSGRWGLSDVLEVGAVYFRDIALKELKLEDPQQNKSK